MVEKRAERSGKIIPSTLLGELTTLWSLFGRGPEMSEVDLGIYKIRVKHGNLGYYSRVKVEYPEKERQYDLCAMADVGVFGNRYTSGTRIFAREERKSSNNKVYLKMVQIFVPEDQNDAVYLSISGSMGGESWLLPVKQGMKTSRKIEDWIKSFVEITQHFPEENYRADGVHRPNPEDLESFLRSLIRCQDACQTENAL